MTKQSDVLPAKRLRTDHPSLLPVPKVKPLLVWSRLYAGGFSVCLAREQSATPSVAPPQESESFVDLSAQASLQIRTTAKLAADVNPDLAGPSQLEESEGSDDSFYELATLDPSEAKRWYVPRSRAEHELELKEKLNAKYAARGKLLEKKDSEILRLSQLAEKRLETMFRFARGWLKDFEGKMEIQAGRACSGTVQPCGRA
ncbi:hypothetical protein Tco_0768231 [Tanacetum coccineum]